MRQQALYMQHRTGHIALGQCDPRPTGRRVVLQLGHQSAVLGLGALEGCWREFAGSLDGNSRANMLTNLVGYHTLV